MEDTRISQPKRVIDQVSEEVQRLLEIIKGRKNENFQFSAHNSIAAPSLQRDNLPNGIFIPESSYFEEQSISVAQSPSDEFAIKPNIADFSADNDQSSSGGGGEDMEDSGAGESPGFIDEDAEHSLFVQDEASPPDKHRAQAIRRPKISHIIKQSTDEEWMAKNRRKT
jgi:hypothetical protein